MKLPGCFFPRFVLITVDLTGLIFFPVIKRQVSGKNEMLITSFSAARTARSVYLRAETSQRHMRCDPHGHEVCDVVAIQKIELPQSKVLFTAIDSGLIVEAY